MSLSEIQMSTLGANIGDSNKSVHLHTERPFGCEISQ